MTLPKLRFGCGLYDRVIPLYSGEVKPEGIDFEFIGNDNPRDIFDKMVKDPAMMEMAAKRGLELDPAPGATVQGYSDAIVKTPPDVVEQAGKAFKG
mgnify:CR=1 FL=1